MQPFVHHDSIVRKIWGKGDTILFIFAGAAAEFALNKAVDWLFFTGRLPSDPLGRLFSTVSYARRIVFSETNEAHLAIDRMAAIHAEVETKRGERIPDWAYRDVLFMLIDYSVRAFETLERNLTESEKEEVFQVFARVGRRMGVKALPEDLRGWQLMRGDHLLHNLQYSPFTDRLFAQYRKHLGTLRYLLLREAQKMVVPDHVAKLLDLGGVHLLKPVIELYKVSRWLELDKFLKDLILPSDYKAEIAALDRVAT